MIEVTQKYNRTSYFDRLYNTSARSRFCSPPRIIFGNGQIEELPYLLQEMPAPIFVVSDPQLREAGLLTRMVGLLERSGLEHLLYAAIGQEPHQGIVWDAFLAARSSRTRTVLGFGGGSVIDVAKAVACLLAQEEPKPWLEESSMERRVPLVVVPTAFGSGAEVTRYISISRAKHRDKTGFARWSLCPDYCLVDPLLSCSVPVRLSLEMAFDGIVHCLESLFCLHEASPWIRPLAVEGLRVLVPAMFNLPARSEDPKIREELAAGSIFGGIAVNNVRTGLIHNLGQALASRVPIRHGQSLSIVYRSAMEFNQPGLEDRLSWIKDRTGFDFRPSEVDSKRIVEMLSTHGSLNWKPDCLGIDDAMVAELAAVSAQDHVLLNKENPVPITKADLIYLWESILS